MSELFTPAYAPFSGALLLVALLAALEVGGLIFGVAFSGLIDGALPDFDADFGADVDSDVHVGAGGHAAGDAVGKLFAWLYLGKAPALIVFASFLTAFGLSGIALQGAADGVFSAALPTFIAAPLAFLAALPLTRALAGAVARIIPKDETDAVSTGTFIGRIAEIIRGEARPGAPAEAKLRDAHGRTHYILIEPDAADAKFVAGDEILIVEKSGAGFRGVKNDTRALSNHSKGDANV